MLTLGDEASITCEGLSRRTLLHLGGLTAFGLNLPTVLAAQAAQKPQHRKDISIILLWMGGGPANMDTFDMKPSAPAEYRGEFRPISTNVSGVEVCEHLPRMARQMDKVCVVKSVSHSSSVHVQADHFMLSGYQIPVTSTEEVSALIHPSYGSVISREKGWQNGMPPYVRLGRAASFTGGGYMGTTYDPLLVEADPNQPTFGIKDVSLPSGVSRARTERRRRMLAQLDRWQRDVDAQSPSTLAARGKFYEQAYGLLTSPAAKKAFDLNEEKPEVRDRYGRHRYGQAALLARRLVEAGVRFVTVETGRWDTHQDNFKELLHEDCLPSLDRYWPALLDDLKDRGLLETTLVMWMGEFGRTPQVNGRGGRDHWGMANAICLSGAGIKMGTVVGKTDKHCTQPDGLTHSTHDLAATVYHLAGIDGAKEYLTHDGRPVLINYHGQLIAEALA